MLRRFFDCVGACLTIGGLTLAFLSLYKNVPAVPYTVAFGFPFWIFIVFAYFIKDYRPVNGALVTKTGKENILYGFFTATRAYLAIMYAPIIVMLLASFDGAESPYLVGYLFLLVTINFINMGKLRKVITNG